MEQLKFAGRVLLFMLFAAVVYVLLLAAIPQGLSFGLIRNLKVIEGGGGYALTRYAEADTVGKVDVIFLGSSLTYRAYDVRIFEAEGLKVFNLGSSSQTPAQSEMLLKRYLDRMDPELVVIEITPNNLSRDGVESALDLIANSRIDAQTWKMALEVGHLYTLNALLYRTVRQAVMGPISATEALHKAPNQYIGRGYVQRDDGNKGHKPFESGPEQPELEFQYQALERMVELLRSRNTSFVLVDPVVSQVYYQNYPDLAGFHAKMDSLGPFLEMNEFMELNDSLHFYDTQHLEQSGVKLYNAEFIKRVREMGLL